MRIQEIVNITDGRDKNFSVDFLFLFFDFYLKTISNQALVFMRDVKCSPNGRTFWQKVQFFTLPLRGNSSVQEFVYIETF